MINCAAGCWHSKFFKTVHVTGYRLSQQVVVKQCMKKLHYSETKTLSLPYIWRNLRISNLPLKYGKAASIAQLSEFGNVRVCAASTNYFLLHQL